MVAVLLLLAAEPPRFEHRAHAQLAGWDPEVVCATCHSDPRADVVPPSGALMHSRCNASGCHAVDFDEMKTDLCLTCHATQTRLPEKAKEKAAFPSKSPTYYAEISHKVHRGTRCADCHASKEKRPAHPQCSTPECHGGKAEPPMTMCQGCHRNLFDDAGKQVWTGPSMSRGRCRVTAAFSHAKHEERQAKCGDCHLSVTSANRLGELVATNGGRTMEKGCGKCHDGKKSFSVKGSCETCHTHACVVDGP